MRLVAAALALAVLPAYPALAQEDERAVTVEVSEISAVLRPGDRLTIRGNLVNTGDEAVRDLQLRLYVGSRVETRFELARIAGDGDRETEGAATRITAPFGTGADDDVGPRASLAFTVDVPAADVAGLGRQAGVHPLRLEARSRRTTRTVGVADTFLQWWPANRARSRIAWVWPLAQPDDRDVDGVYADDSLAEAVRPGGRLVELLHVADGLSPLRPVTWAVDPARVSAVADMADGYRVRAGDESVAGQGEEVAKRWLADLDAALSKRQSPVLALPYADPDVVAVVRAGAGDRIGTMLREGRQVLQQRLGVTADATLAWPPGGLVSSETLDVLTGDGVRSVVLDERSLRYPDDERPNHTPTSAMALGDGGTTGLVADHTLAEIVATGADGGGDRLDVQRFLAETALIALERPSSQRAVVVTPPRDWAPLRPYARSLLEQSATVPWLEPTTLPALVEAPERADVERFVSYPDDAVAAELSRGHVDEVVAERKRLGRFRSILERDTKHPLPPRGDETLDRAVSVARRDDAEGARRLVDSVRGRLDGEFGRIRIITGGIVTLTSDNGRIPVTIENGLGERVLLRVTIDAGPRLQLDQNRPVEQAFAEGKTQLTIDARAVQSGEFTIAVKLLTPDGDELPGGTATLRVRSTAYGKVALVITIGAFAVLLGASVTRLVRRRSRPAPAV